MQKKKERRFVAHVGSYELKTLHDWLLTPEKDRKEAVFNWTSGYIRHLATIIERYYKQKEDVTNHPKYEDVYRDYPFMCHCCKHHGYGKCISCPREHLV